MQKNIEKVIFDIEVYIKILFPRDTQNINKSWDICSDGCNSMKYLSYGIL